MERSLILLFIGLLYILVMGGLSLLRREGLSTRFAIESLILTGAVGGLDFLTGSSIHPIAFLILLYLVTMRVRLLVDLGNTFASRGRYKVAGRVYQLADRMGPDPASQVGVHLNQGVASLQQGQLDEAITAFKAILARSGRSSLGLKHEAACHYNLGVAYQRKGLSQQAVEQFQAVLEIWPVSEFARRASLALNRETEKTSLED